MKLRVKVKLKHIRATRKEPSYDAYSCPVARALNEACPNYTFAVYAWGIDPNIGFWPKNGKTLKEIKETLAYLSNRDVVKIKQPESVREFVQRFDKDQEDALPFAFDLDLPDDMECK